MANLKSCDAYNSLIMDKFDYLESKTKKCKVLFKVQGKIAFRQWPASVGVSIAYHGLKFVQAVLAEVQSCKQAFGEDLASLRREFENNRLSVDAYDGKKKELV